MEASGERRVLTLRLPALGLRPALAWLLLCVGVGVVQGSAVHLGLESSGRELPALVPLVWHTSGALAAWVALPVVLTAVQNAPPPRGAALLRFGAVHGAGYLAFTCLRVAVMLALRELVGLAVPAEGLEQRLSAYRLLWEAQNDLVLYAGLVALFSLLRESRLRQQATTHAARLETALVEAQLRVLTSQLDPHFLFNTLNTVGAVMHEDVERAERLLADLGEMLRATLGPDAATWSLAAEVEYTGRYLALLRARFEDRLRVEWAIAPGLDQVRLPRFGLQSLVENATKHNRRTARPLTIRIGARAEGDLVRLCVEDDGVGFARPLPPPDAGRGLGRLAETLRLLYGERGRLATRAIEPRGAGVDLVVPREGP